MNESRTKMYNRTPVYYAEMYAHQQNTSHKVGSVKIPVHSAEQIAEGKASVEDVFGTDSDPGPMRVRLQTYVPARLFKEDVTFEFRLTDSNGLPVVSKQTSARAKAEEAFGGKKE